jgi:L-lactate dehydrogenase complex protein LldE
MGTSEVLARLIITCTYGRLPGRDRPKGMRMGVGDDRLAPMRIGLFLTCLNDTVFPQTGRAVVRLLERLGHEVDFPMGQTCCGQMHVNTGYRREAHALVRRFVETFEPYEAVVTPSGSCAALVRDQHVRLARESGDARLAERAQAVASRTYELSVLLVDVLGVVDVGAYYPHRVTYHPTCHSLRLVHVGDRPLRLLRAVRGIDLVELPDAESCCGFGGTFALKNAETSTAMLGDKVASVVETRAEVCTAGDNSCLMHIGGGLSRLRSGIRTVHLAEILASTEPESPPRPRGPLALPPGPSSAGIRGVDGPAPGGGAASTGLGEGGR